MVKLVRRRLLRHSGAVKAVTQAPLGLTLNRRVVYLWTGILRDSMCTARFKDKLCTTLYTFPTQYVPCTRGGVIMDLRSDPTSGTTRVLHKTFVQWTFRDLFSESLVAVKKKDLYRLKETNSFHIHYSFGISDDVITQVRRLTNLTCHNW